MGLATVPQVVLKVISEFRSHSAGRDARREGERLTISQMHRRAVGGEPPTHTKKTPGERRT